MKIPVEYMVARKLLTSKTESVSEDDMMKAVRSYYEYALKHHQVEPDISLTSTSRLIPEVVNALRQWVHYGVISATSAEAKGVSFTIQDLPYLEEFMTTFPSRYGKHLDEYLPVEVDGPDVEWTPNADAGDSTGMCTCCGQERDEPHTWEECAHRLSSLIDNMINQACDADEARYERGQRAVRIVRCLRALDRVQEQAHSRYRGPWSDKLVLRHFDRNHLRRRLLEALFQEVETQ